MITKIVYIFAACVLCVTSQAKGSPPKESKSFFVLFDDGCEHPVEACENKMKLPTKLTKTKELKGDPAYLGTLQTEFADKNEAGINAHEHYFSTKTSCESLLKKKNCGPAGEDD